MATSIDGRIVVDGWPDAASAEVRREYQAVHESYGAEGWICGRVTMEPFAGKLRSAAAIAREHDDTAPRDDFIAPGRFTSFAFALDASGRLDWQTNDIEGDHVVSIVSERVSDEYLAALRERDVSYLVAGARDVDLALALAKIAEKFGVKTLMLEGGGGINGSFLRAHLVDEVSLLIAPVADARTGTAALFDLHDDEFAPASLSLDAVERRAGDVVWLRYRVA